MTRRRFLASAGAAAFLSTLPAVAFGADDTAIVFARSLYALENYWSDITADRQTTKLYLDDNLAALIEENYNKEGFESALDYDPLLQAQDWDEVITQFTVAKETAKNAVVTVALENFGERTTITLDLTLTPAGWRLSDIIATDGSSLVAELKRLNAAG